MKELRSKIKKNLKKRYPHDKIVSDGILDDGIYKKQKVKVMFLLKETYGGYVNIIGGQKINNGKSVPFWPNIFNWTKLVNDLEDSIIPKFLSKGQILEINKYVDNIAYVNIKKIEGNKKSNNSDIMKYAEKDRDILQCQIDEINPDVIFISDSKHYEKIYNLKNIDKTVCKEVKSGKCKFKLFKHNNRRIIKIHHPSYLKNQKETFNSIVDLLN